MENIGENLRVLKPIYWLFETKKKRKKYPDKTV